MLVKHGMAGGKNLFEVLYGGSIEIDFNLQRIILECVIYDSEIESDFYFMEDMKRGTKADKYTITGKRGPKEIAHQIMMERDYPEYLRTEVTLLSSKDCELIGKSAHYYRDCIREGKTV